MQWAKSLTSDVIYGLYLRGTGQSKGCTAKVFKLWMDWVEPDWNEKEKS
jgi:hypothetical protein